MAITIPNPNHPREKLLTLLRNLIEKPSASQELIKAQKPLIDLTIQSLNALRYGEVQTIFCPQKTDAKGYGNKPYTLRVLRMKAIGIADLLIAKEFTVKDGVLRMVANKLDENADTFRKWRTKNRYLGKTTDTHIKSFRLEIAKKTEWDIPHILDELEKLAVEYLQAQGESKKP